MLVYALKNLLFLMIVDWLRKKLFVMAVNWADQMMNLTMELKEVVHAQSCDFVLANSFCGL
ncbi:hypothetical protein Pint_07883 [Pistacia integerrima]|uniref:Uncharacterized protein n=1 Tax=Pistacia integerrima TaxID=434235 RepID=A0ACC0XYW2_9ROSI|nr:hypothetical protein Pint_07883 [Pistacia integerrima]